VFESLRAAQTFLDDNAQQFGGVVTVGARGKLQDTVAELSTHVSGELAADFAVQGATGTRRGAFRVVQHRSMSMTIPGGLAAMLAVPHIQLPAGRQFPD
jgi:hypothetical protein